MSDTVFIQIREVDRETHELLKERAKRNRRSLNQQLIVDLEGIANAEYAAQQADDNKGKV